MKKLLIALALTLAASFAQTSTTLPGSIVAVQLPNYIACGAAYNQLNGPNFWCSAILPVSNQAGVYESTTMDLLPIAAVDPVTKKKFYTLSGSLRQGVHKVLYNKNNNMLLIGGDAGLTFSQTNGSTSTGPTGSFTITYVRQLNATWAIIVPVRALWVPNAIAAGGAWNPVAEIGVVWKP